MKKKINRRKFIKNTAIASSIAVLSTNISIKKTIAKTSFNWKMVTTWPKNFPGLGTGAEIFAKTITKASGGRLNISVFGAEKLFRPLKRWMLFLVGL